MKKFNSLLTLIITISLLFSGCSSRTVTYQGKTEKEWQEMGINQQYNDAVEQRDKSLEQRKILQRKCINKTSDSRISAANACTSQLKALDKNIEYFNVSIEKNRPIIKGLISARHENDRQAGEEVKDYLYTLLGWVLIGGLIYWVSTINPEEESLQSSY